MPKGPWDVVSQEPIKSKGNAPSDPWSVVSVEPISTPDFPSNPKGEGLYEMYGRTGKGEEVGRISVPYSKVPAALASGFTWYESSGRLGENHQRDRYMKDKESEGKTPSLWEQAKEKHQSALEPSKGWTGEIPIPIFGNFNTYKAAMRTVSGTPQYLWQVLNAAYKQASGQGDLWATELMDLIDPTKMPEQLYKQFQSDRQQYGDRIAADNLTGTIEGLGIVAVATHGASKASTGALDLPKVKVAAENVRGAIRDTLGATENTERIVNKYGEEAQASRDVLKAERQKVAQENIEEVRKQNAAKEETEKHNQEVMRDEKKRSGTQQKLSTASDQLKRKIEIARKKAKAADDSAWDTWRKKVAGTETPSDPIVNEIKNVKSSMDPEDVAEFRKIIKESKLSDADRSELQILQDEIAKRNLSADSYDSLTPDKKHAVDEMIDRLNLDPDNLEDSGGAAAGGVAGGYKPVNAERLHVWKTQLEYAVRKATRGNVRYGIGQVLDKVREAENDLSKAAGADKELETARALHGPYVDTFRNSPNTPNTVASYVASKVAPEFTRDSKLEDYIGMLGKYDPSIPKTVNYIYDLQQGLKALPKEGPLREKIQVPPPPLAGTEGLSKEHPVLAASKVADNLMPKEGRPVPFGETKAKGNLPETPNIQTENLKYINEGLRRYGKVGGWVLRMIVGGGTAAFMRGEGVGVFGSTMLIGQTGVTLLTRALRSDSLLNWLAKPSVEDMKLISTLPPEDAARMREILGALKDEEIRQDPKKANIKIAPAMVTWLAGTSASRNQKNTPHIDDVKKKAEDLQNEFHKSGLAPSPTPPEGTGPQSRNQTHTHIWDATTNRIVPV
jgi:hypothetical protein